VSLSSRGLKNIVCGREFEISKFKAQFISPAVSRNLRSDPTQSSFTIEVPDSTQCFESILSICEGKGISVKASEVCKFAAVCRALGNEELIQLVIGTDPVSISNVGLRLALGITDKDVGFACENFVSLDHSSLPVNILELLLADDRLKIESEDWLLKIVGDRISSDGSLIGLLDYIESKYLSVRAMSDFVSLISPELMSSSVWSSICSRLQLPISVRHRNPRMRRHSRHLDRNRPSDDALPTRWNVPAQRSPPARGAEPLIAGLEGMAALYSDSDSDEFGAVNVRRPDTANRAKMHTNISGHWV
jgi:hypothetical protein